jgi:MscS family membrane protein
MAVLVVGTSASPASAQAPAAPAAAATAPAAAASAPAVLDRTPATPRGAAHLFITLARDGEWSQASALLQEPTTGWPDAAPRVRLARALKMVLDERLWLDFAQIPGSEANAPVHPGRFRLGTIEAGESSMEVDLVRVGDEWLFAASTVTQIPPVARALGAWWVSALPPVMVNVRVAEIELWQWIGLVLIGASGILLGFGVSRILRRTARIGPIGEIGIVAKTVVAIAAPAGLILSLLAMRLSESFLGLSVPAKDNLSLGSRALTVLVVAWGVARWLRVLTAAIESQLAARGIEDASAMVKVGRLVATALVYLLGVSAALQIFGLDLSAVIAGLGIGTAAIALASQQTLGNLFGGASVIADRVLRPGDVCSLNGTTATVERIGIRSTQLRTLDRTLLVVANGDLAQSRVEKLSARDGFRMSSTLGLRYETTPQAMRAVLAALRHRLETDSMVVPESILIHFMAYGASSLDVDVKAVIRTVDFLQYREAVERINLDFMEIVAANGSGFAFPSQTVYLARDSAPQPPSARLGS